ncbi:MAG: multidrug efflux SMR transporter [Gammaproteobacteria bacterium]|nr:multidrug efflux SMR transporter [Gammaproteobacteria bacterium]
MSHWIYLSAAIATEVAGTVCMKLSNGFEQTTYSVLVFVFYGLSFYLLTIALKHIDVSIAYAIWAGAGVALISVLGLVVFNEPLNVGKVISLLAIVAGVVGLNLSTTAPATPGPL